MSDRRRHPPDLPVSPFDEFEGDPPVRDGFPKPNGGIARGDDGLGVGHPGAAGKGSDALHHDSPRKGFELFGTWNPLDLDPVPTGMRASRFEEACGPAGFVAEEQESFGIGVEPADRKDPRGKGAGGECAVAGSVRRELG